MENTGKRVDFHTHILPLMDDGSRSVDESIKMLQTLAKSDVGAVVLTPHFYANGDDPEKFLVRRSRSYAALTEALGDVTDFACPKLILGAEVEYFEGIMCMLEHPELRLGKTGCILVEMPHGTWTYRMVDDILELNERSGFRVVLAHVERYLFKQKKDIIHALLDSGVMMQSNTSFFLDRMTAGKAARMVKRGIIHLLGSDCHNLTYRPPNIGEACDAIAKRMGDETVEALMQNALDLLRKELGTP